MTAQSVICNRDECDDLRGRILLQGMVYGGAHSKITEPVGVHILIGTSTNFLNLPFY